MEDITLYLPSINTQTSLIDEEIEKQQHKLAENQNTFSKTINSLFSQEKQKLLVNGTTEQIIKEKLKHIQELEGRMNELTHKKKQPTEEEIAAAIYRYNQKESSVGPFSSKEYHEKLIDAYDQSDNDEKEIKMLKARIEELSGENKALRLIIESKL